MFKKILATSILAIASVSATAQEVKIEAIKAPFHVGKSVMACGQLAEVKHFDNRHYLNLDRTYPNQTLTLLVRDNKKKRFKESFGRIDGMVGKRFCARGTIEEYKNNLQMKVNNPQFLRLMK